MLRIIYFSGSKFMFWAYQNHLLHLLTVVAEDYPAGLHQIKETSMIKTEYKTRWSSNQGRSRKEEIPYHSETEYAGLLYAQRQSQKRRSNHE